MCAAGKRFLPPAQYLRSMQSVSYTHLKTPLRGVFAFYRRNVCQAATSNPVSYTHLHQRVAQPAAGDQLFHGRVAAVIAPHEADLYQPLAAGQLRLHDLFAVRRGLRERLFAEYVQMCIRDRGRPALEYPANWDEVFTAWKNGEITAKEAMERTGTKRTSFYKLAKNCNAALE